MNTSKRFLAFEKYSASINLNQNNLLKIYFIEITNGSMCKRSEWQNNPVLRLKLPGFLFNQILTPVNQ